MIKKPFKAKITNAESIKVKAESDDAAEAQLPDIQPEASTASPAPEAAQDAPQDPTKSHPPTISSADTGDSPGLIPKAPPRRSNPLPLLLSFAPLFLALIYILVDPAGLAYFKVKLIHGDSPAGLANYTKAFNAQHDLKILEERADTYAQMGMWMEAEQDLRELIKNNIEDSSIYASLARDTVRNHGLTSETLTLLHKTVAMTKAHYKAPPGDSVQAQTDLYWAALDLLTCGDHETVLTLCNGESNPLTGPDRMDFLKALALREMDQDQESRAIIKKFETPIILFPGVNAEYFYFEALSDMDHSNTAAAARAFEKGAQVKPKWRQDTGLKLLTSAWLLYQQGNTREALKTTGQALENSEKYYLGIPGFQQTAALRLLRAQIFMQLHNPAKMSEELKAYKKSGCLGTIYIPKVYRGWINEARAGS